MQRRAEWLRWLAGSETGPRPRLAQKLRSCCAWAQRAGSAQGTVPSALPGSATMTGCFARKPDALTCHPRRRRAARLAVEHQEHPKRRRGTLGREPMRWRLRTELRTAPVLRSRAPGPVLTAPAGELRPFCARAVRDPLVYRPRDRPRPTNIFSQDSRHDEIVLSFSL